MFGDAVLGDAVLGKTSVMRQEIMPLLGIGLIAAEENDARLMELSALATALEKIAAPEDCEGVSEVMRVQSLQGVTDVVLDVDDDVWLLAGNEVASMTAVLVGIGSVVVVVEYSVPFRESVPKVDTVATIGGVVLFERTVLMVGAIRQVVQLILLGIDIAGSAAGMLDD